MAVLEKTCSICHVAKPADDFYREKRRHDGLGSRCKDCQREYMRAYQAANQDKIKDLWRRWREENDVALKASKRRHYEEKRESILARKKALYDADPEFYRAKRREWKEAWKVANPEKWQEMERRQSLKKNYGISIEQYDEMFDRQDGVCAICGGSCSSGRRLGVDHDHETGRVRGLLCVRCNHALGCFLDDPELMRKAIDYLGG